MNDTPSEPVPVDSSKGTIPCTGLPVFPLDTSGTQIDHFNVLAQIGEGGMGAVYLAEDTKLARRVAVKRMKPELAAFPDNRERFIREARAAAAVDHDNVVPILHIGEATDGTPFIVMPFLQGETLDARLKREGTVPLDLLLKVTCEVADGLAAAHAKGLIHRDIKPGNVWLEGDPGAKDPAQQVRRCKVLDFGLARPVEGGDTQLTGPGTVLGTPAYMAPEQAQSKKLDPRTDLFSLGATLYRAATGKLPFEGETPMAVLIALTTESPIPVREHAPHLPPAVAELIDRLMSRDPARRPQSAVEVSTLARTLAEKLPRHPLAADPLSTSYPQELLSLEQSAEVSPELPAKRQWLWVATGVCLFVLVPVGLWLAGAFGSRKVEGEVSQADPLPASAKQEPPKVEPPKKEQPKLEPVTDPERAAALFVLSFPGSSVGLSTDTDYREAFAVAEVPKEPFRITKVRFAENAPVTDAGLAVFKPCRSVIALNLKDTPVGDAGLAHFAGCKGLANLYLHNTKVSGKGLAAIKNCQDLKDLTLSHTQVTDADLVHIKPFTALVDLELRELELSEAAVNDLAKVLPGCRIKWNGGTIEPKADFVAERRAAESLLDLGGTVTVSGSGETVKTRKGLPAGQFWLTAAYFPAKTTDANLEVFKNCKNLTIVYLAGKGVTGKGLAYFRNCKHLKDLTLTGTEVGDDAIDTITQFTNLSDLAIGLTKISPEGVNKLAKALPSCRIQHNGGTIEPRKK